MKEIENTPICKDRPCSWIGIFNIVKLTILPSVTWDSMKSLWNISGNFHWPEQIILRFLWKRKRTWRATTTLNLEISHSLTSDSTTELIKTYNTGQKRTHRPMEQDRFQIETPVVTINKGCKTIQWGKTISSITGGKTGQTCKKEIKIFYNNMYKNKMD